MGNDPVPALTDEQQLHRKLGADLFNGTWTLLEKADRSPDEDALMIHMAHASAYHWLQVGAPENFARSHWQYEAMARAYSGAGDATESGHWLALVRAALPRMMTATCCLASWP